MRLKKSIRYSFLLAAVLTVMLSYMLSIYIVGFVGRLIDLTTTKGKVEYVPLLIIVSLVVFMVIFLFLFYMLTQRIIKYFSVLSEGLSIISVGKFDFRVPVRRGDELGELAMNINRMAEQLERQKENEKENEVAKMNLITGVSHDLRTPLTSIIGYLDLLRKNSFQDEKEHDRFVNNAYSKAEQLKKLIDDLFVYTRLTSGDLKLTKQHANMRDLVEQVLFEFIPIAEEHRLTIRSHIEIDEAIVFIDPEQMARILDNLLMNALKYSILPKTVDVHLTSSDSFVYLTIANDGEVITKEQEAKLFERYYKIGQVVDHQNVQIGTGLGLAIARQLAEHQGGHLSLNYKEGHYAFTLKLPFAFK